MDMEQLSTQFYIGLGIGLFVGGILGFMIARRRKYPDNNITALQLLSFLVFFGYVAISFAYDKDPQWVIAIGILATGYGAKGGELLEKILEKKK